MRRRDVITLLGSAAAAWPLAARAQQAAVPVVGFLSTRGASDDPHLVAAVRQGLKDAGYVEGQNVAIEYRFAEHQNDRLPGMAADVRRRVAVITAGPTPAALAARAATSTIPIVFEVATDPVTLGLVASLSRPGGNITGVTNLGVEIAPKRLEMLHELLPAATTIALLINPTSPTVAETLLRDSQAAAGTLGLKLHVLNASADRDLEPAFADLARLRADALVIGSDPFFTARRAGWSALEAAWRTLIVWPGSIPAACSRARSQPTCRSSSPPE
jgi:putative ABC transport system substrate-binding protein